MSLSIASIEERVKEIETALQQAVAHHSALTVALSEAKYYLDLATKTANVIAPESPVTGVLDLADKVADEVIPDAPAAPDAAEAPAVSAA